jgi:hypothetical protein
VGAEAATLDVDSAFRCCPIRPSQQQNFVVQWNDSYYIDHNAPFGATSAGGVFGRVADAKSAILASKGLGPSKNWVDDFAFFRFPISSDSGLFLFSYSLSDIYALADLLGWPWKHSKTRPFDTIFKYLGFIWDLSKKTVQIPDPKKQRYLAKLEPWTAGKKFSRKDAESILGTLVHCSLAVPDGRSRLPALSRFTASFNFSSSPFTAEPPTRASFQTSTGGVSNFRPLSAALYYHDHLLPRQSNFGSTPPHLGASASFSMESGTPGGSALAGTKTVATSVGLR